MPTHFLSSSYSPSNTFPSSSPKVSNVAINPFLPIHNSVIASTSVHNSFLNFVCLFPFSVLTYMAEEFEESEVIFPDCEEYNINDYYFIGEENSDNGKANKRTSNSKKKNDSTKGWETTGSLPVDIPSNVLRLSHEYQDWLQEEYDGGELVPPHKIVEGRIAGKMAFSVCTGSGRTLKGRDLSDVRNSILRLTGFLET